MMKSNPGNERRNGIQRRHGGGVLPAGMKERRINIERRMFNLDAVCVEEWLRNPAPKTTFGGSKSS